MAILGNRGKTYASPCRWVEKFIFFSVTTGVKSAPARAAAAITASQAADAAKTPREGETPLFGVIRDE